MQQANPKKVMIWKWVNLTQSTSDCKHSDRWYKYYGMTLSNKVFTGKQWIFTMDMHYGQSNLQTESIALQFT